MLRKKTMLKHVHLSCKSNQASDSLPPLSTLKNSSCSISPRNDPRDASQPVAPDARKKKPERWVTREAGPHSTFLAGAQSRIPHFLCGRLLNSCSWEGSDSHPTAGSFFSKSPWHLCSDVVTRRFDFLCNLAGLYQRSHSALPSAFCACLWSGQRTHDSRIKTRFEEREEKAIRLLRAGRDFRRILDSFTSKGNRSLEWESDLIGVNLHSMGLRGQPRQGLYSWASEHRPRQREDLGLIPEASNTLAEGPCEG